MFSGDLVIMTKNCSNHSHHIDHCDRKSTLFCVQQKIIWLRRMESCTNTDSEHVNSIKHFAHSILASIISHKDLNFTIEIGKTFAMINGVIKMLLPPGKMLSTFQPYKTK